MLIIENLNSNTSSEKHKVLAHAQTISNFFVEAIDQNDCNVKVVLGFYQELDDTINSILDLDRAFNRTPMQWYKNPKETPSKVEDFITDEDPIESDYLVEAAIKAMKDKCFDCKLSLPKINFHNDLSFLYEKLKLQLDVFYNVFEKPRRDNFCHLAYGLQKTCIPDLIKMIAMLLTAYAAIMALRKLPSFSLNIFIKGVISSLLVKIVGSINISLDMNSTGLPCLLSVLEELASKIPTNESLYEGLSEEERSNSWIKDYESISIYEKNLKARVDSKELTAEYAALKLEEYKKKNDPVRFYTKALEEQLGAEEEAISEVFGFINDIVGKAQGDINSYIDSILGVINFFECEAKRSGSDFTEILEYINDLNRVINMISSIIGTFLKKALQLDLCKDEKSMKKIEKLLTEDTKPLTPEDLKDILEEFNQVEAQISEDGLAVLLYDKPKKPSLPKLTLMGCNFKEFAEAHRLDNLIKTTISDFVEENKARNNSEKIKFEKLSWSNFGDMVFPSKSNSIYVNKNKNEITNYNKDLKSIDPRDKIKLQQRLNNNLISKVFPSLKDKDISDVRDVIKNYFNNNYNNYYNYTNNIINNNFIFNEKFYTFINKVDAIKVYKEKVIDKIDISYEPIKDTVDGFTDSLDELLDFIYNNPFEDDKKIDIESIPVIINKDDKGNLNLNNVFKNNNDTLKDQQGQYTPNLTECRSVEDVMAVLNNIKI